MFHRDISAVRPTHAQGQLQSRRAVLHSGQFGGGRVAMSSSGDGTVAAATGSASGGPDMGRVRLDSAAVMIPHPQKADRGGEDAFFIADSGLVVGVADGVGGWAEVGVDPGLYSRELMRHANDASKLVAPSPAAPADILARAHGLTKARGSCTACILVIEDHELHAANLGDSGA